MYQNNSDGKRAVRRLSNLRLGPVGGQQQVSSNKENKRPLTAVLSEDGASCSNQQNTNITCQTPPVRHSFLSKLTRNEFTKTSSSAASVGPQQCDTFLHQPPQQQQHQQQQQRASDSSSVVTTTSRNDFLEKKTSEWENDKERLSTSLEEPFGRSAAEADEDDDNLVIPAWPSRSDTLGQKKSEFVQHKVCSLKDYSQVSSPSTASKLEQQAAAGANKLLKSMSQDRKIKATSKRMSECIYSTGNVLASLSGDNNGKSIIAGKQQSMLGPSTPHSHLESLKQPSSNPLVGNVPSASFSMTPGSILLPASSRHAALLSSESKIGDRVRKLFVPLSLRSNSNQTSQPKLASSSARLSFQATSGMLHKPHHMIHAMYRQAGGQTGSSSGSSGSLQAGGRIRNAMKGGGTVKSFRVYGCPLQMANNIYPITCFGRPDIYKQQTVPYVLTRLCNYIEENSSQLTHEGIFRVSGNARLMEKLRTLFDHLGDAPLESESVDVATSASMLKMYLRELPEPLIPTRLNYYFITLAKKYSLYLNSLKDNNNNNNNNLSSSALSSAIKASSQMNLNYNSRPSFLSTTTNVTDNSSTTDTSGSHSGLSSNERQRVAFSRDLTKLLRKLPIENYNLLKYLACFLYRVSLKQEYNKMCAEALGIVFGPNIFRIRSESYKGLKEQELSNQIMASIISNYTTIFDSELTDPLGNLVAASGEQYQSPSSSSSIKTVILDHSKQDQKMSSPLSQFSDINQKGDKTHEQPDLTNTCCPKHCRHAADHIHDEEEQTDDDDDEEEYDDDDDDDDDNDDDDDCEGESYTPSSGSGSYCSSDSQSQSLESSEYQEDLDENDEENRQHNKQKRAKRHRAGEGLQSASSSDCPSDTSYTPTSSHSNDEDDDLSANYEDELARHSSASSSSLDSTIDNEGNASKPDFQADETLKASPCARCKSRRDSSTQTPPTKIETASGICDNKDETNIPMGKAMDRRTSSRRAKQHKVTKEESVEVAIGEQGKADNEIEDIKTPKDSLAEDDHAQEVTKHHHHHNHHYHNNHSEWSSKQRAISSKKGDFFRRRSSSASSLGRMKRARDRLASHVAQCKRRPLDEHPHNRRRALGSGGSKRSSRGNKSGTNFNTHHYASRNAQEFSRSSKRSQSSKARQQLVTNKAKKECQLNEFQQQIVCENVSRLSLTPNRLMQDLGLNDYLSVAAATIGSECLETFETYEDYFLLRPFNSDETLLRSWSYNEEFEYETSKMKNRRRFSGHDALDSYAKAQLNLLQPQVDYQPEEIREEIQAFGCLADNYSVEIANELARQLVDDLNLDCVEGNLNSSRIKSDNNIQQIPSTISQQKEQKSSLIGQTTNLSSVSLLSQQNVSYKQSLDLNSVNDNVNLVKLEYQHETSQDVVTLQMKAWKDLVKTLKKLQKYVASKGYSSELSSIVNKMSELSSTSLSTEWQLSSSFSDDYATCSVDYLSANSMIELITSLIEAEETKDEREESPFPSSTDAAELERLNGILTFKMKILKQRYNDLKSLREHYLTNHLQALGSISGSPSKPIEQSKEICKNPLDDNNQVVVVFVEKSYDNVDYSRELSSQIIESAFVEASSKLLKGKQHLEKDTFVCSSTTTTTESLSDVQQTNQEGGVLEGLSALHNTTTSNAKSQPRVVPAEDLAKSATSSQQHLAHPHKEPLAQASLNPSKSNNDNKTVCCQFGSLCPMEFVFNIEKQLAMKRILGNRVVKLNDMTLEQLQNEKLELQKNLLRYEHWFGRPLSKLDYSLVGHLYERYRAVKLIKTRKGEER